MNMTIDRKALKSQARERIRLSDPKSWKANCVYLLVTQALPTLIAVLALVPMVRAVMGFMERLARDPGFIDAYVSGYGYYGNVYDYGLEREAAQLVVAMVSALGIFYLISILVSLFKMAMSYGHCSWSLKLWRGEHPGVGEMFSGFSRLGRALGAGIMTSIFTSLWSMLFILPGSILLVLILSTVGEDAPFLAAVLPQLANVAMMVGVALVSCRYALTPYFILSDPRMGVFEAIRASRDTMEGNITKLFCLRLSFLGWGLLVGLIVFVVVFLAVFVGTYITVFLAMAENPALWNSYISDEAALGMATNVLWGMLAGGLVAMVVSFLLTLPLCQWLNAYMGVSVAGFFDTLTSEQTQAPWTGGEPAAGPSFPSTPPVPPAPPVSPAEPLDRVDVPAPNDPFGQVDTPQVEDPFDQTPPQAPQLPQDMPEE